MGRNGDRPLCKQAALWPGWRPAPPTPTPRGSRWAVTTHPPTLTEPHGGGGGARLPFIALQVLIDGGVGHCLRLDAHGAFVEVAQEGFCVAQQEAEL